MLGLGDYAEGVNDFHYSKGFITEMKRSISNIWLYKIGNNWFLLNEIAKI